MYGDFLGFIITSANVRVAQGFNIKEDDLKSSIFKELLLANIFFVCVVVRKTFSHFMGGFLFLIARKEFWGGIKTPPCALALNGYSWVGRGDFQAQSCVASSFLSCFFVE